ncbi:MAG: YARHG domain-containing protein [Acidobacteria bacterium]|nr:YARHG domain-containing protein [Acidobacteriota bacterium]
MKKILLILFAVGLIASCSKTPDITASKTESTPGQPTAGGEKTTPEKNGGGEKPNQNSPLLGTYTGGFEAVDFDESKDYVYENRITISIDSLDAGTIAGHSVVAGNNRPFKGTFKQEGKSLKVEAAEPGDDQYDGSFSFTIDPDGKTVSGTWTANNKKLSVSKRKYALTKKQFRYDASLNLPEDVQWTELYEKYPKFPDKIESLTEDVTRINASARELTKKDVENMYKGDLEIIRNAIYARHGYSFKNRRIRFIFDQFVPWYMPLNTDIRTDLTEIEKKNIELLKRYEDHAERYYDEYGR